MFGTSCRITDGYIKGFSTTVLYLYFIRKSLSWDNVPVDEHARRFDHVFLSRSEEQYYLYTQAANEAWIQLACTVPIASVRFERCTASQCVLLAVSY